MVPKLCQMLNSEESSDSEGDLFHLISSAKSICFGNCDYIPVTQGSDTQVPPVIKPQQPDNQVIPMTILIFKTLLCFVSLCISEYSHITRTLDCMMQVIRDQNHILMINEGNFILVSNA